MSSERDQRIVVDLLPFALRREEKLDLEDLKKETQLRTKFSEIPFKGLELTIVGRHGSNDNSSYSHWPGTSNII